MDNLKKHLLGFWEVVNKPSEQELTDYYANKYYQMEKGSYRKSYPEIEIKVIKLKISQRIKKINDILARDLSSARFLDVGCGEGFALAEFKKKGWEVEGIDHSLEGIKTMNPELIEHVEKGNIFNLLDKRISIENKYDVVWLNNVLEHVIDPLHLLGSIRKLIAEQGILVVTVPNDFSELQEMLIKSKQINERFWVALPDHLSYFSVESLKNTAKAMGWRCEAILADFPIDFYLANDHSNYVADRSTGAQAHNARLTIESLIGSKGDILANNYYEALAKLGLGRNITGFLLPEHGYTGENHDRS